MKWIISSIVASFILMHINMSKEQSGHPSEAERAVNLTLNKAARQIENQYPLFLIGQGASMPEGDIHELSLSFDTKNVMTKMELRNFLLNIARCFLEIINSTPEINKFLTKKPFCIENVTIIIYNLDTTGRESYYPNISTAQISDGILTFRTLESPKNYVFNNQYTETYEEALKLVSVQKKE